MIRKKSAPLSTPRQRSWIIGGFNDNPLSLPTLYHKLKRFLASQYKMTVRKKYIKI